MPATLTVENFSRQKPCEGPCRKKQVTGGNDAPAYFSKNTPNIKRIVAFL